MIQLSWLDADPQSEFPPLDQALEEPDGLLAAGGDLSAERLLNAYRHGIFPWFSEGEPILWWSPNPRCVLFPERLKISRSLRKTLKKQPFEIRFDSAFADVMHACAQPRPDQSGTWITYEMFLAYVNLHQLGYAHSVECWHQGQLVGGLYGVALGRVFFGESMFSRMTDASKIALVHLRDHIQERGFRLIDAQVHTPHLESLGAEMIPRRRFAELVRQYTAENDLPGKWSA